MFNGAVSYDRGKVSKDLKVISFTETISLLKYCIQVLNHTFIYFYFVYVKLNFIVIFLKSELKHKVFSVFEGV